MAYLFSNVRRDLHAVYYDRGFRAVARDIVTDEAAAARQTAGRPGLYYFQTYMISTTTLDGIAHRSDPIGLSPRRYVCCDRTYSHTEALRHHDRVLLPVAGIARMDNAAARARIAAQEDKGQRYILRPETGRFVELQDGERVYDSWGRRLWPLDDGPQEDAAPLWITRKPRPLPP